MKKFQKVEAFTGLEAAIVLIAFVVVAAVFSYVVLGAGFFTTQKAQQVVYSGVQQSSSNLIVMGEVYGDATGTTDNPARIHAIIFNIGLTAGGSSIDLNKTVLTYQNKTILKTLDQYTGGAIIPYCGAAEPGNWKWCIKNTQNADADATLERNEQFTIQANLTMDSSGGLMASDDFTLQIRPDVGAAIPLHKSAPGGITPMNLLL